jgi:gluconokinase
VLREHDVRQGQAGVSDTVSAVPFSVLAIDVGSSSVRSGLYDGEGNPIAGTAARRPHRFTCSPGGRAEADAEALSGLVIQCIDETLASPSAPAGVTAVAFCTFLHGLLGTDGEGRALTPVITWADTRSWEQAARLAVMLDAEGVRQRTGCPLYPAYFPSKLLWFRENQPRLFHDVRWWCSIGEYCLRLFTGARSCALSMASSFGLLNRRTCGWDGELLETLCLDEARLSPLRDMESPARGLLPRFAGRWPALREAAWFPALGDGACSNVGCGCASPQADSRSPGRVALMIGTTGAVRTVSAAQPAGLSRVPDGLWAYRLDRSRELIGGVLGDGGNLFEWMGHTLHLGLTPGEIDAALLAASPAGHGLTVLPFLTGERSTGWNPRVRGAVIGLRLETSGLDILQAGVEAVAYRFAAIMGLLRAEAPGVQDVIGTGGALRTSTAWGQILADVLEMPLLCSDEAEASSRGAALLAAQALGHGTDADGAPPRIARTFFPRPGTAESHRAARREQERLREAILR